MVTAAPTIGVRPSRHVRAVIFDMDGTLLDSLPVVLECYRQTVVAFGGPDLSPEEIIAAFSIGPAAKILEALIGRPVGAEAITSYESRLEAEKARILVYDE